MNSLRALYPSYTSYHILAGLSGNVAEVERALRMGADFAQFSSWRYVPGLATNGRKVIIYDVTENCGGGGRRMIAKGRFVGYTDGTLERVPIADWSAFVRQLELKLDDENSSQLLK